METLMMGDKQPCVLIIEDSPSQALRLKLLLARAGYAVCVARDGAEGWEQAYRGLPDVILLDINLPCLDGFELLALLKREDRTADIPVVMLSSFDRVRYVERAVELGAAGYLFKDDCLFRQDGAQYIVDIVEVALGIRAAFHHVAGVCVAD